MEVTLCICNLNVLTLVWPHNERDGVSNHRRLDCLFNRLLRLRSKKTSKLCVTGLWEGNAPMTGGFSSQRASNTENVSDWWRQHGLYLWNPESHWWKINYSHIAIFLLAEDLSKQQKSKSALGLSSDRVVPFIEVSRIILANTIIYISVDFITSWLIIGFNWLGDRPVNSKLW